MKARTLGFAGVLLALSTTVLMQTFVSTTMPVVVQELGGMGLYSWVFGAYMLATTVTIPLSGQLGDTYGRRPVMLAGVATFLAGSVLAAVSRSMAYLVVFRAVQGIGAGLLGTAALAAVGDLFQGQERGRYYGIANGVQVLANLAGPVVGAWVAVSLGWRWGFFLILPIGGLVAIAAWQGLGGYSRQKQRPVVFDWVGSAAIGLSTCFTLLGFQGFGEGGVRIWLGLAALAVATPLWVWAIRVEAGHENPAVPLEFLALPLLRKAVISSLVAGMVQYGAVAYIPLLVQGARGGTVLDTAAVAGPMVLGAGVASILGGRLVGRLPYHLITTIGLTMAGAGFLELGLVAAHSGTLALQAGALLVGFGVGLYYPSLLVAAQEASGDARRSTAVGLVHMARNMGGAVGVPLLGIWLSRFPSGSLTTALVSIFYTLAAASIAGLFASWERDQLIRGHG